MEFIIQYVRTQVRICRVDAPSKTEAWDQVLRELHDDSRDDCVHSRVIVVSCEEDGE